MLFFLTTTDRARIIRYYLGPQIYDDMSLRNSHVLTTTILNDTTPQGRYILMLLLLSSTKWFKHFSTDEEEHQPLPLSTEISSRY
jgi:hypothetical protein